jgi:hypothetical protein
MTIFYPNLKSQLPVFISPRNSVAQLYPRALGSLFVAPYNTQDYGGDILIRLHTGQKVKVKVMLRLSVSQYVLVSWPLWNLLPDIIFCLKVAVLSLWGTLADERSGLLPVSHCQQYLVHY